MYDRLHIFKKMKINNVYKKIFVNTSSQIIAKAEIFQERRLRLLQNILLRLPLVKV